MKDTEHDSRRRLKSFFKSDCLRLDVALPCVAAHEVELSVCGGLYQHLRFGDITVGRAVLTRNIHHAVYPFHVLELVHKFSGCLWCHLHVFRVKSRVP